MNRLFAKCTSRAGETLTETLCAIVVMAIGALLFATMVTAAANINTSVKKADQQLYTQLTAAETQSGTGKNASLSITRKMLALATRDIVIYGGDGVLTVYRLKE